MSQDPTIKVTRLALIFAVVLLLSAPYYIKVNATIETGEKDAKWKQPAPSNVPSEEMESLDQSSTLREMALDGKLTLLDIKIEYGGLKPTNDGGGDEYHVKGFFCQVEWELQQKNPSLVPMFKDLRANSESCRDTLVEVDIYEFAKTAREKDEREGQNDTSTVTGIIFHESRCGSTLVANQLASFWPRHTRVYSESAPPIHALQACDNKDKAVCDPQKQQQMIQDVFYLMGRSPWKDSPQYAFYKIQSAGTLGIQKFTTAMPDTPWMFLYRDSVEVLMSHLKKNNAVCTRSMGKGIHQQPQVVQDLLQKYNRTLDSLDMTEYCAIHLTGLSMTAVQENYRTKLGYFVNYDQLPDITWEKLLPSYFGVGPLEDAMIETIRNISSIYSKGRYRKVNQEWTEDSTEKHKEATPEIIAAAEIFLGDVYEEMEALSKEPA